MPQLAITSTSYYFRKKPNYIKFDSTLYRLVFRSPLSRIFSPVGFGVRICLLLIGPTPPMETITSELRRPRQGEFVQVHKALTVRRRVREICVHFLSLVGARRYLPMVGGWPGVVDGINNI